jgi:hypothetical protein
MSSQSQQHMHTASCGHRAVNHEGHVDYLKHGHLEHQEGGRITEHVIAVSAQNPVRCTPGYHDGHAADHHHGTACGHEAVPHGDHTDYLSAGHLHHPHGDHCDDHGALTLD